MSQRPAGVSQGGGEGPPPSEGQGEVIRTTVRTSPRSITRGEASSGIVFSKDASGEWTPARAREDRKDLETQHQLREQAAEAEHRRAEQAKDNDQRRLITNLVVFLVIASLLVATWVGTRAENDTTRTWAQGIVTLLLGGILGAVGGYFSAKAGK